MKKIILSALLASTVAVTAFAAGPHSGSALGALPQQVARVVAATGTPFMIQLTANRATAGSGLSDVLASYGFEAPADYKPSIAGKIVKAKVATFKSETPGYPALRCAALTVSGNAQSIGLICGPNVMSVQAVVAIQAEVQAKVQAAVTSSVGTSSGE